MPTPEGARVGRGPARTGRWEGVPPHAPPDPSAITAARRELIWVRTLLGARGTSCTSLRISATEQPEFDHDGDRKAG